MNTWVSTIIEWSVVAMISRRTSSVSKEDVAFQRLLYCDSRCSKTCPRCSQACRPCSQVHTECSAALQDVSNLATLTPMVLLYQSSEIFVILMAGWNGLLASHTLLKLVHLYLHFTSSQIPLEASSDKYTSCCWIQTEEHCQALRSVYYTAWPPLRGGGGGGF